MFDLISDIHLDFWINPSRKHHKWEKNMNTLIEWILPPCPSKILIIAGDLGHYNKQNMLFLTLLKNYYQNILLVFGNHDYYLVSGNMKNKYRNNSINRITEMKAFAKKTEGIYYLDGDAITVDGVTYGGTGMWYDYSFAKYTLNKDTKEMERYWFNIMNDARLIHGMPNTMEWFYNEKEKLDAVIKTSDVIVTHVGPLWDHAYEKHQDEIISSFYSFNGSEYIVNHTNKIWCFGHAHLPFDEKISGIRFVNQTLGYPNELKRLMKIKTIE